jgi:tetratricopeptide (TPR) repeat protein
MTSNDDDLSTSQGYLKQAEAARQRQAWDEAIKIYQVALRQLPDDGPLRLGLAQAYEAKARQMNLKPIFLMALQEYWRLIHVDPSNVKAVDGLLAVAYNAGQLAEVMEEFRALMTTFPEVDAYKQAFKKIETLFLFSAEPNKTAAAGSPGIVHTILGRGAPLAALVCLLGWVIVRMKGGPTGESLSPLMRGLQALFFKTTFFLMLTYVGYQGFLRLRNTK